MVFYDDKSVIDLIAEYELCLCRNGKELTSVEISIEQACNNNYIMRFELPCIDKGSYKMLIKKDDAVIDSGTLIFQ